MSSEELIVAVYLTKVRINVVQRAFLARSTDIRKVRKVLTSEPLTYLASLKTTIEPSAGDVGGRNTDTRQFHLVL